jgi:hypothetical protein
MQVIHMSERHLVGVPELKFDRAANVIQVGQFPRPPFETLQLSERGLWRMYLYRGGLVRRRWRLRVGGGS